MLVQQVPLYQIPPEAWSRLKYGANIFVYEQQLGRQLRTLLAPGETFYEWGAAPGLYFDSLHSPPSGAFYAFPLMAARWPGHSPCARSLIWSGARRRCSSSTGDS